MKTYIPTFEQYMNESRLPKVNESFIGDIEETISEEIQRTTIIEFKEAKFIAKFFSNLIKLVGKKFNFPYGYLSSGTGSGEYEAVCFHIGGAEFYKTKFKGRFGKAYQEVINRAKEIHGTADITITLLYTRTTEFIIGVYDENELVHMYDEPVAAVDLGLDFEKEVNKLTDGEDMDEATMKLARNAISKFK